MRWRRNRRERLAAVVEMTPLIDMVFILLIFFIVATSFVRETGVQVDKPESNQSQRVAEGFLLVAITRNGSVHVVGTTIAPDDRETVQRLLQQTGSEQVVIQADRQAPVGLLLRVQDTCLAAGARQVAVSTEQR
jgi:biopolymer transport protein ExbD